MAKLTIHHAITRLLRDGIIEGNRNQTLYDTLLDGRGEVESHLRLMGMELVIMADHRIAHARNMTDEALDGLAEDLGCEPISPICQHNRLSFYDSVAVVYFRTSLDQEARQGGDEIWLSQSEVNDVLSRTYAQSVAEDRLALEDRIERTLKRLCELNLLATRKMGKSSLYRGRPLMQVAFSRNTISEFAEQMNLLADEASPTQAQVASQVVAL